jgi:hypothetical protein
LRMKNRGQKLVTNFRRWESKSRLFKKSCWLFAETLVIYFHDEDYV